MFQFLLARLWQSIVLLALVSVLGFAILHLAPGGPLSQFVATPGMTAAELQRIAEQMGLNRPLPIQYLDWASRLLTGDWGRSYRDGQPVLSVIGSHLFATLLLMISAILIAVTLGCWIGMKGAVKRNSAFDHVTTFGAMIGLSIPTFWFGLVAIYVFSLKLGWLPSGNMYTVGNGSLGDYAEHLILPSAVLGLVSVAVWSRYMRSATLDTLNQDYVRTARAKGASPRQVLRRHILRNSMLPIITLAGLELPTLLSGALVTETVFTWPGMGRLFLDSLNYKDYPVVMGLLMVSAILVILANSLADVFVAIADPRIRNT
ncbi:ABC transporter permease [Labrys wisconsinensis]|uniref:Peptide/nickel transport system permease protein n=1 Tax=Labrys wisconsinensis TaxID=425677 RepID=A0ABU0JIZ3_9HYPH|nr:ABC transporter permease [Labrys wisconsinensis]MDQ0473461.1 peptide/nickel transport system permease protein [Labrys wisconsinensis]